MTTEAAPTTDRALFPSGTWKGFYVYRGDPSRHRMDLQLTFSSGLIDGEGGDDVGAFTITGRYDQDSLELNWNKAYTGSHSVHYRGFREGRGIWGTWTIGSSLSGGFRIWPDGMGSGESAAAQEAIEAPSPGVVVEVHAKVQSKIVPPEGL